MILSADFVHNMLEVERAESQGSNNIYMLALIFFIFTFLAATQDVVVDGWALTMLSK